MIVSLKKNKKKLGVRSGGNSESRKGHVVGSTDPGPPVRCFFFMNGLATDR